MKKSHLFSYVIGSALLIAVIGDFAGHLWGRPSPHPWWVGVIFGFAGFLLMFPEKLEHGLKLAAKYVLPWKETP